MTTWPNTRPYANLDEGQMTVMRKPTRFLVESPWKESSFEKPYLEGNPRGMQFAFPKMEISFPDLEWPDHKGLPPYGEEYIKKTIKFAFPKCDTRPTEIFLDGALADSRAVARFDIPPLIPNDGGFEWSIEVSPAVSLSVLEISIKSEDKRGLSAELSILLRECVENLPEEVTVTVLAHSKTKLLAETQKYIQLPQIFNAFSKGPLDTFTEVLPNEVNGRITKNKQAVAAYLNQNNQPPNFGNTAIPPKEPPSLGNAERYFGNRDFNCGTLLIELICCPAIPGLNWDIETFPFTVIAESQYEVYILGGKPPFFWTVDTVGQGTLDAYWANYKTTVRVNTLHIPAGACGSAIIVVNDYCSSAQLGGALEIAGPIATTIAVEWENIGESILYKDAQVIVCDKTDFWATNGGGGEDPYAFWGGATMYKFTCWPGLYPESAKQSPRSIVTENDGTFTIPISSCIDCSSCVPTEQYPYMGFTAASSGSYICNLFRLRCMS